MKLEEFLKPTQAELFSLLREKYDGKNLLYCSGKFILVKGDAPVMLVAHLDTVHAEKVKTICKSDDGNILMSPQGIGGDDRCGVYALSKVYETAQVKPFLLFTCDEETGGIGADYFCKCHKQKKLPPEVDNLKCIVEIDRRGSRDAVYYDCDNKDFEKYITSKGFVTAQGSFSDISYIAPELGTAAVNLSSGYYNAHTQHEFINRSELETVIEKVVEIVADSVADNFPKYDFVKKVFGLSRFSNFDFDFDDDDNFVEISAEYAPIYDELLDYYSEDELNEIVEDNGEEILQDLLFDIYHKNK